MSDFREEARGRVWFDGLNEWSRRELAEYNDGWGPSGLDWVDIFGKMPSASFRRGVVYAMQLWEEQTK